MALRAPRRATTTIDEALGFVGFFGVVFFGVTVFCELTGRPALGWAVTLLVCVVAVVLLRRRRRQVLRRTAAGDVAPASGAPRTGALHIGAPDAVVARAGRPDRRHQRASGDTVASHTADGRVRNDG